ncbi:ADP-ribosylation factor-related protein 1 isoform X1 [Diceros bicornis minor]|uniref:ADP-ribosylation factor-related protein 1 isoform X1 n=1 Tax=Diceros bicornis minor TaxID=77932 RepID=UPI0026EAD883|nr:ADP-ribosylation factor-related protein 1 isoform X1 [Diceros bicornis minor]
MERVTGKRAEWGDRRGTGGGRSRECSGPDLGCQQAGQAGAGRSVVTGLSRCPGQDVHAAVGPVQVHVSEGRVLHPDLGSGQCREDDLSGAVKNPVQQELQGDESIQNHHHRGSKHWHCGCGKGSPPVLGLRGAGRAAVSVGQEKMVTSEALDGVPILVLANKQDVEACLCIPDIKTAFSDCTSKIGRRDCLTQACSALTGKGVREGIEWMVKCVVRNVHRPPRQRDIT